MAWKTRQNSPETIAQVNAVEALELWERGTGPSVTCWIIAAAIMVITSATPGRAQTRVDAGPIRLSVSESWTAQVFHIVDQLAEWDARAHRSYMRWAERTALLDSTDRTLLSRHAKLRLARGWAHGFEQTFLTDADIRSAARSAVDKHWLTRDEASAEVEVLEHFSRKLAPLREESAPRVHAFAVRLAQIEDSLASTLAPLAKLTGVKTTRVVPTFVVGNPDAGSRGGRFVAGRLVIEIPERPDALASFHHEAAHVLFAPHAKHIEALAGETNLSADELNEAIAYAFSPGLTSADSDPLAQSLENALKGARSRLTLVYMTAIKLRPILRESMARGDSMPTFLARAGEALHRSSLF